MAKYKGKYDKKGRSMNGSQETVPAPQKKGARRRKMPIALRIVIAALSVIFILAAVVAVIATHYLNKINRDIYQGDLTLAPEDLMEESEMTSEEDSTEIIEQVWEDFEAVQDMPMIETEADITNYLLVGCDDRGDSNTGNSDSMMIVSVNKDTQKIHITSLMRGCFVIYPEGFKYEDGMLNWSYAWGGAEKLIETVEMNFKVNIDHFIAVSFEPFVDVVDAIGGIDVEMLPSEVWYVNARVTDHYLDPNAGFYHLNGEQALAFSRCRGAVQFDNDFIRTSRQRDVVEAIIHQAGSLNVTQLTELANTLLPAVSTDMTNADILSEVINIAEYADYEMDQLLIPFENQEYTNYVGKMFKYGAEMYAINWETNLPKLEEFING